MCLNLVGMRKKLTTKTIDALPAAVANRYEVRDELLTGFMVKVSSVGKKVFYLNTRINGRASRIKIGDYPLISLAEARQKAQGILRDISSAHMKTALLAQLDAQCQCLRT